jgi:hypothetical protein
VGAEAEPSVWLQVDAREIDAAGSLNAADALEEVNPGRTLLTGYRRRYHKKAPRPPKTLNSRYYMHKPAPSKCGGVCCGDPDCPAGQWCLENKTCGTKCGMLGTECCNGRDCVGNELSCDSNSKKCVKAAPKAQCGTEGNECCNGRDCIGNELLCEAKLNKCIKKPAVAPKTSCGDCCGDPDCPAGQWCLENKTCGSKCGMEGTECCNGRDCVGNELSCDSNSKKCVKAAPKAQCGTEGNECCNGRDCIGNELFCEAKWNKCMKKPAVAPKTSCGDCCGDPDCPAGQWCLENKTCGSKCGMEGTECCNGRDCVGNELFCEAKWNKCMKKVAVAPKTSCGDCCGDPDCPAGQWCLENKTCGSKCGMEGTECCNGRDCVGNELSCDAHSGKCVKAVVTKHY